MAADILLIVRAVHLTATVMACGAVFFYVLVAAPAVREVRTCPEAFDVTRVSPLWVTLKCTFAVSLCVALISGVTWFLEVATAMGEGETDDAGTLAVLTGTQFGRCCLLRLAMAAALACCFPMFNPPGSQSGPGWCWSTATLAAGFAASLAWTGHAGAMPGVSGCALLLSDILHLVAVSSWVGGLVPLAVLIWVNRAGDSAQSDVVVISTRRFSIMGMVAVATIIASGGINICFLVGSPTALTDSRYGRLLLAKIGVVTVMVAIAAINRFRLTPRLDEPWARGRLARNSLIEAALGVVAIAIVGALGTLPPAGTTHSEEHLEHMH